MGRSTELRREMKNRFYPYVKSIGFTVDLSHGPNSQDFRRIKENEVDVFDIQWEKYGLPRFVINFGKCPKEGVMHLGQPIPAEKVLSYMGSMQGRLRPSGQASETSTRRWFCQDRSFFLRVLLKRPDRPACDVVDELMRLFAELEAWFDTGLVGPHMHVRQGLGLGLPIPSSQNRNSA